MTTQDKAPEAQESAPSAASGMPVVSMMGTTKREPRHLRRPQTHRLHSNIRSVKVLVPRCRGDQDSGFIGCEDLPGARDTNGGWVRDCLARGHDPYHRMERLVEKRPIMNEISPGRFQVTGQEEFVSYVEKENSSQVQLQTQSAGLHLGMDMLTWKRGHGAILPEEHPTKPYAPFCQYYNCWSQDIVVRDPRYGNYCSEDAAKLVVFAFREKPLHVTDRERRAEQLERIKVG